METNTCKRCGKTLQNGEGVNGLCDECLTSSKYKNTDNNIFCGIWLSILNIAKLIVIPIIIILIVDIIS